jgi:predicted ATPase/DNA-binding SARP family transcriptional activator
LIDTSTDLPQLTSGASALRVTLLGPPAILWKEQYLALPRRQTRALLYRLAAAPQPVARDHLSYLIWPDLPEAVARRNLTIHLTQLRRAFNRPNMLVSNDDAVGLNRATVWSDTLAFDKAATEALRERRTDLLTAAVQLYRGPFLNGFALPAAAEYEEWASEERQALERRYLDALTALIEAHAQAGNLPAAIENAQRYLATDDLAEDVHRRLIELYAAAGDRVAAMRQFERCIVVLERELGVSPLPETRAAYEAARDGRHADTQREGKQVSWSPDFPVSQSPNLPVSSSRLPAPASPLIGRAKEVLAIRTLMLSPDARLLTLCGAGGSGKTRLALQAAWDMRDSFADGVVFVPLAPLQQSDLVIDAIAQACGLQELRAVSLAEAVRAYLHDKQVLLVLDNFEHLLSAATSIADLMAAAPGLRILATSRIVLNLSGEHTFLVPPLPLPDLERLPALADLAEQAAIALLVARARTHTPAFQLTETNAADIAAICVQLDGLPLAIELAAARLKILTPRALLRRLDHRLALLDQGPRDLPERQRTLRATIDWSHRLLSLSEQRLFARLAVFAGGWTLAAAEAICDTGDLARGVLDGVQSLLDSHLITQLSGDDDPSFGMLETIREYALERLHDRGEANMLRRRHAIYYSDLVEQQAPRLVTQEYVTALGELDRDYHDIRAALHWTLDAGEHELAARIVTSLLTYWDTRGLICEGSFWSAHVLRLDTQVSQPLRVRVRSDAGMLAFRQGRPNEAAELAAAALIDAQSPIEIAAAANIAGVAAMEVGDMANARQHFEALLILAQEHKLLPWVATTQLHLGLLYLSQGQLDTAEAIFWDSYATSRQMQHAPSIGLRLIALGFIAVLRGAEQQAATLLHDALQHILIVPETFMLLYGLLACCGLAALQQQPLHAARLYGAVMQQAKNVGITIGGPVRMLAQRQLEHARDQSDVETFEQALRQGRSLSIDQAVALAQALLSPAARGVAVGV